MKFSPTRTLFTFLPVIALLVPVACSDDDDGGGRGGAGGTGATGGSGSHSGGSNAAGEGGSAAGAGGAAAGEGGNAGGGGNGGNDTGGSAGAGAAHADCEEGDRGKLALTVDGLPTGVDADVSVSGPVSKSITETTVFPNLESGLYSLTAKSVTAADDIVRTLYEPSPKNGELCVSPVPVEQVVDYSEIITSGKLWVISSEPANLQGFAAAQLRESNADAPAVGKAIKAGGDVAFDREGNVWTFGPTVAEAPLLRYARGAFAGSDAAMPDHELSISDVECLPGLRAMAFDRDGALWLSTCGGTVHRLNPTTIENTSGDVESDAIISGFDDNQDVAFDGEGNLWVVDSGSVKRFDAAHLSSSTSDPADAVLTVRNAEDTATLSPMFLTFDTDGDLWVTDFGGNSLSEVKASDLSATGSATVVPSVTVTLSVSAVLSRPAFDDAGGLWIAYSQGKVAHIAPSALRTSTDAGAPTAPDVVLSSDTIGYSSSVAFFPAASGLPLYHAFP